MTREGDVFSAVGQDTTRVGPISSAAYAAANTGQIAVRPGYSTLELTKIESTGFTAASGDAELYAYLAANHG